MPFTPRQQRILADLLHDIEQFLTRRIGLTDLCTRVQEGIEEAEFADKAMERELLDVWTGLEIIASLGTEQAERKKVTAELERLRAILRAASAGMRS